LKSNRKFLIIAAPVLILSIAGFALYRKFFYNQNISSQSYTVKGELFTNIIEIAGTVSAAKEQKLQVAGIGTVMQVSVKTGDTVKAGDIILRLDDVEQRYNLARHDYEMAQKQVSGSPRELRLMQTQREVLLQRIKDRQIIANFDGIIAEFTTAVGDVFEAKDTVGVIIDRSYLTATVEVAETDAPKLKNGQKVRLKFPSFSRRIVEGSVHSFPAVATKSSRGASVVKAEIMIENPPEEILPNYSFTGEIEIAPPRTFLIVEREAIGVEETEDGMGDSFAEKIIKDGETLRVAVKVTPYGNDFVRINSGLEEGDVLKAQKTPAVSGQARQFRGEGRQQIQGSEGQSRRQSPSGPVIMMPGGGRLR
jgi:multidrug efflux pump subunit AcrA (membrane-fusion protein)